MTTKFEVGETYYARSLCDYETIFSFKVHSRTAASVWVTVNHKTVRRGVTVYDDAEEFKPYGTYSMCPIVRATERCRELALTSRKGG